MARCKACDHDTEVCNLVSGNKREANWHETTSSGEVCGDESKIIRRKTVLACLTQHTSQNGGLVRREERQSER